MAKLECHTHRIKGESWEDCVTVQVEEPEEKGDFWGWLACALASNAFVYGCDCDWFADKCTCREPVVPVIWRK